MNKQSPAPTLLPVSVIVPDYQNIGFAVAIISVVMILFLPLPTIFIDVGLALSIAMSILILMVSLWIQRPLEFSSFPTILLVVTMLRLSLNIATTRVILSRGATGDSAAGHVISDLPIS